jgi:hypothetical protein
MTTISQYSTPAARNCARRALLGIALAAACLLDGATAAEAQQPTGGRLWAAQTGVNQVTLAWDPVPGTAEYRVFLGDPSAPGTLSKRPASVLSGSARTAILTGVQRAANGITLVAVDAGGRVLQQAEFNRVTPATFFPPPTPPTGVTAQATSGSEVVVTWDPVPGATGYVIARAVYRSGLSMLCSLCPSEARYVDRNVMAGLPHTYTVAAIFPSGDISTRVASSPVTPGATQVATTSVVTPPGVPAGALPTTTSGYTPPGQPAGTMPAATTSTTTASTTTASTSTQAATSPTTSTGTSSTGTNTLGGALGNLLTLRNLVDSLASVQTSSGTNTLGGALGNLLTLRNLLDSLASAQTSSGTSSSPIPPTTLEAALGTMRSLMDSLLSGGLSRDTTRLATPNPLDALGSVSTRIGDALSGGVSAPPSVTAAATGPGAVVVSWQPSPTTGLTGYTVNRSLNGGVLEELTKVSPTERSYTDRFFPATLFGSGTVQAKYGVVATASAGSRGTVSNEVVVQPPAPAPSPGGGPLASCRLDFQRADNMWAGFGIPTGSLGTESISLSPGQNKVFITDWKYEKQPNDGTNFYGSHLRIGANPTSSTIRLHLRSWTLTGLQVFARTGSDTFWIRLDPNTTKQFQADLMEVFCES